MSVYTGIKNIFYNGIFYDIHKNTKDAASKRAHSFATQYPNETEACYSFVQVRTLRFCGTSL